MWQFVFKQTHPIDHDFYIKASNQAEMALALIRSLYIS